MSDTEPDCRADDLADTVRGWVDAAERVVVLTGAGISTDSGIPDFRGPQGVWTKNPAAEKQSTIQHYLADPEVRKAAWRSRLDSPGVDAREPNAGHRALVALERRGKLHALVTQNIDELHQRAGNDAGDGDRGARHDAPRDVLAVRRARADGRGARARARRRGRIRIAATAAAS